MSVDGVRHGGRREGGGGGCSSTDLDGVGEEHAVEGEEDSPVCLPFAPLTEPLPSDAAGHQVLGRGSHELIHCDTS